MARTAHRHEWAGVFVLYIFQNVMPFALYADSIKELFRRAADNAHVSETLPDFIQRFTVRILFPCFLCGLFEKEDSAEGVLFLASRAVNTHPAICGDWHHLEMTNDSTGAAGERRLLSDKLVNRERA